MTDNSALHAALASLAEARESFDARQLAVWRELRQVAPGFASRLRELGFDDHGAAQWVCQLGNDGTCPAEQILAGNTEAMLAWLEQGIEGFVG